MKTRLLISLFLAATTAVAQPLPRIIPRSREMTATGVPIALAPAKTRVVVCAPNEIVNSGVELLQARVAKLGAESLTVASSSDTQGADQWTILVGLAASPAIKAIAHDLNVPAELQGYAIHFVRNEGAAGGTIVLAGHDPAGVLYACVTFGRLLSVKDRVLLVTPANARDWPDYKYRALDLMRQVAPCPSAREAARSRLEGTNAQDREAVHRRAAR